MALILLILIGAILGWLASIITRTEDRSGILADIAVGVGGSLLAGLLVNDGSVLGGLSATALLAAFAGGGVALAAFILVQRHRASA